MSSTVETAEFSYQDAADHDEPYEIETAEVKRAGFDEVFALFPINVSPLGGGWWASRSLSLSL
jgi:hypothetical protein